MATNDSDTAADRTARPVGFYVHDHGRGHRNRTGAILRAYERLADRAADRSAVILSSGMDGLTWPSLASRTIELPSDTAGIAEPGRADAAATPCFHYTPLYAEGIRSRVAAMTDWFASANPAALVVDVSAEVALLARLASVPTLVMRQHGDRRDLAHEAAYRSALRLLAPFPKSMEDDITPEWVRKKTTYASAFCRFDPTAGPPDREQARQSLGWVRPHVVVMSGKGGSGTDLAKVAEAAAATPDCDWVVIGTVTEASVQEGLPPNVRVPGWIDDVLAHVAAADAVVSAGGHNSVMELGYARARMVIIPELRPFEEQVRKAAVLRRERLAVTRDAWPAASEWATVLDEARRLDPSRWDRVFDGDGAATLAKAIEKVAAQSDRIYDEAGQA